MRAIEILLGWILLFIVACWTVINMGDDAVKHHGIRLAFDLFSDVAVGALMGASIWRDRLA